MSTLKIKPVSWFYIMVLVILSVDELDLLRLHLKVVYLLWQCRRHFCQPIAESGGSWLYRVVGAKQPKYHSGILSIKEVDMPAGVREGNTKDCPWEIYNKDTGEKEGCSDSKINAQRSANLRNAVAHGWKPSGQPARK